MQRRLLVFASIIGALASLLFGLVFARASDSVTSQGNSTQTGTFEMPHDAEAAVVAGASCTGASYSDGPVSFARQSTIQFGQNGDAGNDPVFRALCIRNNGVAPARLLVSVDAVLDTEVGVCAADESHAAGGNDTTCTDGAAGELSEILLLSPSNCSGSGGAPRTLAQLATPVQLQASLEPGVDCQIFLFDRIATTATTQQRAAAQTDKVQYDLVFTLADPL